MHSRSVGFSFPFALCVPFALYVAAFAKDAQVGGATLRLPPPAGYCEMDRATGPSDVKMMDAVDGMLKPTGNRLLAISADCTQLNDWRTGKRKLLDNLAQYQALVATESSDQSANAADVIKTACAEMRTQGEKIVSDMEPDVRARADRVLKTVKVNEMRFLGVIAEEPTICYAAMLQKFKAETGAEKTQVTVFATTILKGKIVYFYMFAPYESGSTVTDTLALQKAQMIKVKAAN
jgi:hypothetical protein